MVCSSWVNAVFIRNDFPELRTNLISALATLDVHELAHGFGSDERKGWLQILEGLKASDHDFHDG